jgi:hypothetical protein
LIRPDALLRLGFLVPLNIPAVLEADLPFMAACHSCLITSIDSIEDVANLESLLGFLDERNHEHASLGPDLLIDRRALADILREDNYFSGFDEIWLFADPPAVPKPEQIHLTIRAPTEESFAAIAEWMTATNCVVGLGDGTALCYVTNEAEVAGQISSLS